MRRAVLTFFVVAMFSSALFGCGHKRSAKMQDEQDSIAYIIGMNVGRNLYKMDSTLNVEALCRAIKDVFEGKEQMTYEEARTYYLAQKLYFVYEKARAYEDKFIADIAESDRSYVKGENGVVYKINQLGTQDITMMNARDTVKFAFTISDEEGKILHDTDTLRCSYRDIVHGLQDIVRIAGDGAQFEAWLPSREAYGAEGDEKMGVAPNQLVHFSVEINDIKYDNKAMRR